MNQTLVIIALSAFVAAGTTSVWAKDMNAENMSRVMVQQVEKQKKADAEKRKVQQEAAKAANKDKLSKDVSQESGRLVPAEVRDKTGQPILRNSP